MMTLVSQSVLTQALFCQGRLSVAAMELESKEGLFEKEAKDSKAVVDDIRWDHGVLTKKL